MESENVKDRMDVFEEMFARIEEAETDATYYRGILRGEWPNAEEILEQRLAEVKEQNAAQANLEAVQRKHGIID